jgi:hypothetical protein
MKEGKTITRRDILKGIAAILGTVSISKSSILKKQSVF